MTKVEQPDVDAVVSELPHLALVDIRGVEFRLHQLVAKGCTKRGGSGALKICKVTLIKNGRVYLDDARTPVGFPERLAIVTQ
jgi:hypothetical protein